MGRLSKRQCEAAAHKDGPMIVLAGPGSGKTLVLTHRLLYLTQNCRVNPENILVITFTNAAAAQMKKRYLRLTEAQDTAVCFGTFHSVFFRMLKAAYGYTAENILRDSDRYYIIKEAVYKSGLIFDDENGLIKAISAEISCLKNSGGMGAGYAATSCDTKSFRKIYSEYETRLSQGRKIDFDDMLIYTYDLLKSREDILQVWQRHFRYICIDEFQDINRIQYEIVRMLAKPSDNLFIVGDDDQSIYRFRGSDPDIMLHFESDYPSAKRVVLDTNYRSTARITEGAAKVIAFNKSRFSKHLSAVRGDGAQIDIRSFRNQEEEYAFIIDRIKLHVSKGGAYSDAAVLYRTNSQPRLLVEELSLSGIPFCMREKPADIYSHWVAKDVFSYLRLSRGEMDRSDFMRVMNKPNRYLSRDCLESSTVDFDALFNWYGSMPWMYERIDKFRRDLKTLNRLDPAGAIHYVRHIIGYEDYLKEYAAERGLEGEVLLETLDELSELARPFSSLFQWEEHISGLKEKINRERSAKTACRDEISLMTIHAGKGLEFRNVFIIDASEGIIPHKKAVDEKDVEEERRLFYVAMTRARDRLYILSSRKMHGKKARQSRFVDEICGGATGTADMPVY